MKTKLTLSSLKFLTWSLLGLLLVNSQESFSQKVKVPKAPLLSITNDSTCNPGCHYFEFNIDQLIGTDNLTYTTSINNAECLPAPANAQMGCLLQHHNAKWILIKVLEGKDLSFTIDGEEDVDAAIWGPVENSNLSNSCEALAQFPISCDYSAEDPIVSITDAQVGEYYVLMVSNFANIEGTVNIHQPIGGKVKFAYHCPENIELNSSLNGDQTQNAFASMTLRGSITDAQRVNAFSGHEINLLPGFNTASDITFEAKIQGCVNTTEDYNPPSSEIECEAFANHTASVPHIYTNYEQNELVGTVFAKTQPEYLAYGEYYKMTKVGKDKYGDRYLWAFRHPYQWETNVYLRTAHGCPTYPDTRYTKMQPYLGHEDTPYPTDLDSIEVVANIDSPFWLSCDLNQASSNHTVYVMYLRAGLSDSLSYRINGGFRYYNAEDYEIYEPYNNRFIKVTKIGPFNAPKDFVMDFTTDHGESFDRYFVGRTSAGGHFSVTTTFTREADGEVTVNTFQGDINVEMSLGDTRPTPFFGNTFKLGQLPVGDHSYPLKSIKGEYTLDENIVVKVRDL